MMVDDRQKKWMEEVRKQARPTLVTPMAPTFSPKVLVPLPAPHSPASSVPRPSVPSPRFTACSGGGGAAAHARTSHITCHLLLK